MQNVFHPILDRNRITAIEATPVPSPSGSPYPGNHLFVNVLYTKRVATEEPVALVATARADLVRILQILVAQSLLCEIRSLCVTFIGPRRSDEFDERLYRYALKAEFFPQIGETITIDSLLDSPGRVETSAFTDVSNVLGSP